jgi:hypothetical protein
MIAIRTSPVTVTYADDRKRSAQMTVLSSGEEGLDRERAGGCGVVVLGITQSGRESLSVSQESCGHRCAVPVLLLLARNNMDKRMADCATRCCTRQPFW